MIYLIKGKDQYLVDKKINEIIKKHNINNFDIHKYDGSQKNFKYEVILEDSQTLPMFSEFKAVLFNNPPLLCNSKKEDVLDIDSDEINFIEYCQNPNFETILIFYSYEHDFVSRLKSFKIITKNANIINLSCNDPKQFINDARNIIKQSGLKIDHKAEDVLLKNSSNNYALLDENLKKLKLYGDTIDSKVLESLTDTFIEDDIFEFTNALFDKNIALSFKIIDDLYYNNYSTFHLIACIAAQLRFYVKVYYYHNEHYAIEDIMKFTNSKKEYRIIKALETLRKYQNINILEYLYKLAKLEQTLKTNNLIDEKLRFELFILELIRG